MLKISHEESIRIELLRFPLIILVVFIHIYGGVFDKSNFTSVVSFDDVYFYDLMSTILSQTFSRVAVPLFFIISSFFLFFNFECTSIYFKRLIDKKIRTLVIPYVFFNLSIMLLYFIVNSYGYDLGKPFSFYNIFDAFFGITGYPAYYQFWFIRDLIFLIFLSPLVYCTLKSRYRFITLSVLLLLWFFNVVEIVFPIYIESLLFFYVGGLLRYELGTIFISDNYCKLSGTIFLSFSIIYFFVKSTYLSPYCLKIIILSGLLYVTAISKRLSEMNLSSTILLKLAPSSFFVFTLHEPILVVSKKLFSIFIDYKCIVFFEIFYVVFPFLLVTIIYYFYLFIKNKVPFMYNLIFGR